jgi:hypothetical protein
MPLDGKTMVEALARGAGHGGVRGDVEAGVAV